MGVDLLAGGDPHEVGAASFFHSFFSTICVRLEGGVWGSKFPRLMLELYQGRLPAAAAGEALLELAQVRRGLAAFLPRDLVWDADDRSAQPPWGLELAAAITSLDQSFVTSDGQDLLPVLQATFEEAQRTGQPVVVQ